MRLLSAYDVIRRSHRGRCRPTERKNAMRTLLVAAVSAIGIGIISTTGASALPVNAWVVGDAVNENPLVSKVHYYPYHHHYPYYHRSYYHRPYYRPYYHHRYWYRHRYY